MVLAIPFDSKRVLTRVHGRLEVLQFLEKLFHGEGGNKYSSYCTPDGGLRLLPSEIIVSALRDAPPCHPEENLSRAKIRLEGYGGAPQGDTIISIIISRQFPSFSNFRTWMKSQFCATI